MLHDLLNHETQITQILKQNAPTTNWEAVYQRHLLCLYHLQYERVIHLLVTLTVTLATVAIAVTIIFSPSLLLLVLFSILLSLLVPYILHYQKLENTTQRWYSLEVELESRRHPT